MQAVMDKSVKTSEKPAAARGPEIDVRFVDLVKQYGPVKAVDHVSLDVARGGFLTLLGPSGSGKKKDSRSSTCCSPMPISCSSTPSPARRRGCG